MPWLLWFCGGFCLFALAFAWAFAFLPWLFALAFALSPWLLACCPGFSLWPLLSPWRLPRILVVTKFIVVRSCSLLFRVVLCYAMLFFVCRSAPVAHACARHIFSILNVEVGGVFWCDRLTKAAASRAAWVVQNTFHQPSRTNVFFNFHGLCGHVLPCVH